MYWSLKLWSVIIFVNTIKILYYSSSSKWVIIIFKIFYEFYRSIYFLRGLAFLVTTNQNRVRRGLLLVSFDKRFGDSERGSFDYRGKKPTLVYSVFIYCSIEQSEVSLYQEVLFHQRRMQRKRKKFLFLCGPKLIGSTG